MNLTDGIPLQASYMGRASIGDYTMLESYAEDFVVRNAPILESYTWSKNPFHHWSRQWEYPYVAERITNFTNRSGSSIVRVLDAGSGVTFFPYFLLDTLPQIHITCCDSDSLESIYSGIDPNRSSRPEFIKADIGELPLPESSLDLVYSVSVLEHVSEPVVVIDEFARVLRPKGQLVLTFDISLNRRTGFTFEKVQRLFEKLEEGFEGFDFSLRVDAVKTNKIVTTDFIRNYDKSLLPWEQGLLHDIKRFVRSKVLHNDWRDLTFCCLCLKRKTA